MADTALIRRSPEGGLMAVSTASEILDFADKMGRVFQHAGIGGATTEPEGKVLALACIMRGKDPFELLASHHIIGGKLAKKADVMLADFNARGGKHRWLKDGNDGNEAALELSKDGEKTVATFSIKDATEQGLVKDKTRWKKGPKAIGSMLRARCCSEGIRMLDPSVAAGIYTPEELEDVEAETAPEPKGTRKTKAEVEARRQELTGGTPAEPVIIAPKTREPGDEPIDAEFTSTATEPAPFDTTGTPTPTVPATTATPAETAAPVIPATTLPPPTELTACHMEIAEIVRQMGATPADLIGTLQGKFKAGHGDAYNVSKLDDLPLTESKAVMTALAAKLAASKKPKQ